MLHSEFCSVLLLVIKFCFKDSKCWRVSGSVHTVNKNFWAFIQNHTYERISTSLIFCPPSCYMSFSIPNVNLNSSTWRWRWYSQLAAVLPWLRFYVPFGIFKDSEAKQRRADKLLCCLKLNRLDEMSMTTCMLRYGPLQWCSTVSQGNVMMVWELLSKWATVIMWMGSHSSNHSGVLRLRDLLATFNDQTVYG